MATNFDKCVKAVGESGIVPGAYFLSLDDVYILMKMAKDEDMFDMIYKCYCAGFRAGNRCTLRLGLKAL